jgi:hypothetical protein
MQVGGALGIKNVQVHIERPAIFVLGNDLWRDVRTAYNETELYEAGTPGASRQPLNLQFVVH